MSRKGYARLAEDMVRNACTFTSIIFFFLWFVFFCYYLQKKKTGISNISRDELWCKAHTKKNGDPPNSVVADYIVSFYILLRYECRYLFKTHMYLTSRDQYFCDSVIYQLIYIFCGQYFTTNIKYIELNIEG